MSHPTLNRIRGVLDDVMGTEEFDFIIPDIPGADNSVGRDLAVLCQNAVYPDRSNEIIEVNLHGQTLSYSGRAQRSRTMSITYVDHASMFVTKAFRQWLEFQRGTNSGLAADYKSGYAVDGAVLIKYDVTGAIADTVTYYGLQPESVAQTQLGDSGAFLVNVSLRFDFDDHSLFDNL